MTDHLLDPSYLQDLISKKPNIEKIKAGYPPDYLTINEIVALLFSTTESPTHRKKHPTDIKNAYKAQLIQACKEGKIKYEGDITGWTYQSNMQNPYKHAGKGKSADLFIQQGATHELKCTAADCAIHRDEFKRYLIDSNRWPIGNGILLKNWLKETKVSEFNAPANMSEHLAIANHVYEEIWRSHDPDNPPTNDYIVEWIRANYPDAGLSNNEATSIARITRPNKYKRPPK